ncbi:nickel-dependent hydrogenase large subunit [Paramagnetospirillum magneticum]|uniref:Ni,Fe-hydrogenase I large subunit n=1 Tax=Paramagnetospirillum magneticum (strain ATCC 700264 / AMB-1) TaxID=342108 RepID=Q2W6S7_PARM1|nr:nickel-dependent hydrogenase large subunit [Paramagnetospirillum magneticum]BAE50448.1 Ni,Fe-hydrogenase I large subunit [Paramagnetospirillum magneticum AMB-1]
MLPFESSLSITLHLAEDRVETVEIGSSRPVQASDRLTGRRPDQVLALLPNLYSLCGTAQGLAGLAAVENAVGIDAAPEQHKARRILCLIEMAAEHAAAALRDWPALLGEAPDLVALKPIRPLIMAVRKALYPEGDWLAPGGGRLAPDRETLTGIVHRLGEAASRGDLVADRLLARVEDLGMEGFGAAPPNLMPETGPPDLDARLAADDDGAYRTRPDSAGIVFETGPLARQSRRPLMGLLMSQYGNGLMPRFSARMMEMASALREVEDLVQDLSGDSGGLPMARHDGSGLGVVDAARGLLAHRVELREGLLSAYRILAPTEWNFHPDGPLAQGLRGMSGPDPEGRAALLAASLDPCVPFRIEVVPHA